MKNIVIVGAGTMGHGIAQVFSIAGFSTTLIDQSEQALINAGHAIFSNLESGKTRNKVTPEEYARVENNLAFSNSLDSLSNADLFIEAIIEDIENKKQLFAHADTLLPQQAIMASNTSSLSITEIGNATKRPSQVVGMHFFNPVHIMKLVEIIRGKHTSDDVIETTIALSKSIQKQPIVVEDHPGFATSRLGVVLGLEAIRMVEQNVASIADIDQAMRLGYGHPVGPLELTDLVGLDVRLAIATHLYEQLKSDTYRPPELLKKWVAEKRLGKKTGHGFYRWKDGVKSL